MKSHVPVWRATLAASCLALAACGAEPSEPPPEAAQPASAAPGRHVLAAEAPRRFVVDDSRVDPAAGCLVEDRGPGAFSGGVTAAAWPGGVIPYEFDANTGLSAATKQRILDAMAHISTRTGNVVTFVQRTNQTAYMRIHERLTDTGGKTGAGICNIGYYAGYGSDCSIGDLATFGLAVHELGHGVGLHHEQVRMDRDRYLKVNTAKIPCDCYAQACVDLIDKTGEPFGLYDYDSVMHYGSGWWDRPEVRDSAGNLVTSSTGEVCDAESVLPFTKTDGTWVTPRSWDEGLTDRDMSGITELYAKQHGWTPFAPQGKDTGANKPLDMSLAPGVTMAGSPAIITQATNSFDVYARGSDGKVWAAWQVNTTWSGWFSLGGPASGVLLDSDPAAVDRAYGVVDIAARGSDGNIYMRGYYNGQWGPWYSVGAPPGLAGSAPALASWGAGRLDVFVRDGKGYRTGYIYQKTWTQTGGWTGWTAVDNRTRAVSGKPSATSWGEGRIDLAVNGSDSAAYHNAFASGKWWGFTYVGGVLRTGTGPSVSSRRPGDVTIMVTGADNRLWIIYWTGSGWSFPAVTGGLLSGSPSTAWWGADTFHVVANIEGTGFWRRTWRAP